MILKFSELQEEKLLGIFVVFQSLIETNFGKRK